MTLADKSLESLTLADLHDLIRNRVPEGMRLEYKRALPGGTDTERKEFLYDISAFANAQGGLVLYGVSESEGLPDELSGVTGSDLDAEISRLQSMVRDGIEPTIPGLQIRAIPTESGAVVAIRVPRSWALPHRVIFKSDLRFYMRNSNGKHPMSLLELRAAFNLSESVVERVRRFRSDRLRAIENGETPMVLNEGARTCLHMVPMSAFDPAIRLDVNRLTTDLSSIRPLYTLGVSYRLNFDGVVTFFRSDTGSTFTYLQVYRSGIFEAVLTALLEKEEQRIPYIAYERALVEGVSQYLRTQQVLGIEPPIFLMLSLQGVKGFTIELGRPLFPKEQHPIDRDLLLLEAIVEGYTVDASELMRPLFDQIWNAAGFERSMSYDHDGKWNPR